jgi:hypothetical protein
MTRRIKKEMRKINIQDRTRMSKQSRCVVFAFSSDRHQGLTKPISIPSCCTIHVVIDVPSLSGS